MQKKNKTAYLRFMCLPEEKEKFEKACNEGGYSMSKVLRKMMNEWAEKQEDQRNEK